MRPFSDIIKQKPWIAWMLFFATVVIVFLIGLFASSIIERRSESVYALQMVKPSKDGGSVMIDLLEKYPEMVVLWAGYSFSKEYNQARGHAHAINDIRNILRTGGVQESPQPATCWTCKSTDVPRLMNEMGTANFYKSEWFDLGVQVINA